MSTPESVDLLCRWRSKGDEQAASELFYRYADRLIALARAKLPRKLGRRVSASDIVQSACRSFFVKVRTGHIEVRPDGDLWQLLAAITMHKVFGQIEHHTAARRSITREEEPSATGSISIVPNEAMARDPSPAEIASLHEERERAMKNFSPLHRQIIDMCLQEYSNVEIAVQVDRTERMVRIVLGRFEERLRVRLYGAPPTADVR